MGEKMVGDMIDSLLWGTGLLVWLGIAGGALVKVCRFRKVAFREPRYPWDGPWYGSAAQRRALRDARWRAHEVLYGRLSRW
jgi:hypothetical protein